MWLIVFEWLYFDFEFRDIKSFYNVDVLIFYLYLYYFFLDLIGDEYFVGFSDIVDFYLVCLLISKF